MTFQCVIFCCFSPQNGHFLVDGSWFVKISETLAENDIFAIFDQESALVMNVHCWVNVHHKMNITRKREGSRTPGEVSNGDLHRRGGGRA